jgi:SEC-C motif-containing protein
MSLQNQASAEQTCPCGRLSASKKPLVFAACCVRYLNDFDNNSAPDAQSLMRSRYSAFVLKRADYLLATWHASTRPVEVSPDEGTKWLGLGVRRHVLTDADHAEVEFVARYRTGGRGARIHETSRFVREAGRWYYVDGDLR